MELQLKTLILEVSSHLCQMTPDNKVFTPELDWTLRGWESIRNGAVPAYLSLWYLILHETFGNVLENFSRPNGQLKAQNTFAYLSCFTFDNPHSEVL